ncbi:MAG: substrate-binding domain-containing protein [Prevotella sp.]|nr:substrate-binding domain-containing protein [Prevotella sp.]
MPLATSCSHDKPQYVIGVSQCSEDIWRDKQNAELRLGAYFHDNVELRFAVAYDSDERQVQQIDSLVATGIHLLIVAPNQVSTISPAIDRAFDKGIPVIVFERKTNSHKYTAYIGADNYEMGQIMGDYVADRMGGKGTVMEVMGLKGSSPAIERHKGFVDALKAHPGIHLLATLQGDWTEESAYQAVKAYDGDLSTVDFVFGQNDRMAMGVRRALIEQRGEQAPLPMFCGIDGLAGKDGGIQLVRDSILDATYIYPTRGDQLLQLAVDILDGKPYEKEVLLMSALVTRDNANVLLMENEEIVRQSAYIDQLHNMANGYLKKLSNQRLLTLFAIGIVALLLVVLVIIYMYHLQRAKIAQEREQMAHAQLDFYTQVSHQLRTPLTLIEGPLDRLADTPDMRQASDETVQMLGIVRRNTAQLSGLVNQILDAQTGTNLKDLSQDEFDAITVGDTAQPNATADSSSEATAGTVPADNGEQPRLLIVDDNADIRTYLRTILQGQYQVSEAPDGQKGLEVACEEVPDLIVSDVMMPVMNGLEFCQRVKNDTITSHIPVILLTARALSKHQIEGYESGADAYITKPFSADLLLARISNLLRSRHKLKDIWGNGFSPKEPAAIIEEPALPDPTDTQEVVAKPTPSELRDNEFIARFKKVVDDRLTDSDLSVEDIASDMHLSRVQLYRKVKALTGATPVELLRKARLTRGRQLLETTSKNISEVAYEVGFSAPSYFTKCYKDEFGTLPGEGR